MNSEELFIRRERLSYEKNKLSSSLALCAIVLNALFFASIFRVIEKNAGSFYYNYLIGISVIYNLLFMLTTFLSSEGVKNYKLSFAIILIVVGILQIARIFILPLKAFNAEIIVDEVVTTVMRKPQLTRLVIYLVTSSILCVSAGIIGIIKTMHLAEYYRMKNSSAKEQN